MLLSHITEVEAPYISLVILVASMLGIWLALMWGYSDKR